MNITTRVILLFLVIIVSFAGFFYMFYTIKAKESRIYVDADNMQRRQAIDSFLTLKQSQDLDITKNLRSDSGLRRFVQTRYHHWASINLAPMFTDHDLDLVQVYGGDKRLIYGVADENNDSLADFVFDKTLLDSLSSKGHLTCVTKLNNRLLMLAGSIIHPASDTTLTSAPEGFMIVGRIWNHTYLSDIGKSLNYTIRISMSLPREVEDTQTQFNTRIVLPLNDWLGNTVAWVIFYNVNPYLSELGLISKQIQFGTFGFLLLFIFIQFVLLNYWITTPLKMISTSLRENEPKIVSPLTDKNNEFADIAILIKNFFHQKHDLIMQIEERIKTEIKFRESEEQTRKVFLTSPEAIFVTDLDGGILTVNEEALRLSRTEDYQIFEQRIKNIIDLASPDQADLYEQLLEDLIKNGSIKNLELDISPQEGHPLPALFSASVIYDANHVPNKLILIARDLSDLKSLELKLRQSQKMESIGTLAGGIAHDFNNIITIIAGYTALAAGKIDHYLAQNDLDEALKACLRAKSLIGKILTFSRQSEKTVRPCILANVIEDTIPMIRASIPTIIKIKTKLDVYHYVLADPNEIQQVLMNLASNAFHAMRPNGGTLSLTLEDTFGFELIGLSPAVDVQAIYVHFKVSDTGVGISPEIMDRIFDPYFSTKAPTEGTGLGLSIVHGIISSYNGFITVQSHPGSGTAISIYLPIISEPEVLPQPQEKSFFPFHPARILYVDDEPALSDLFDQALVNAGYQVTAFTDSQEAMQSFIHKPEAYDLMIADVTMPNVDGIKLATIIRSIRNLPIILYTGFCDYQIQKNADSIGINKLLNKPILPDELVAVVREVVAKSLNSTI